MSYAVEVVGGVWYGVKIPSWLRAFDCRIMDEDMNPRAPWGESLWACERAIVDLGLSRGWKWDERDASTPVSGSGYRDLRTAPDEEIAAVVARMVEAATEQHAEYRRALKRPIKPGEGGSVHYMPAAVALCNYGWAVIADRRVSATERFGP